MFELLVMAAASAQAFAVYATGPAGVEARTRRRRARERAELGELEARLARAGH